MKSAAQVLPRYEKQLVDLWMNQQMKDEGLREDLISGDDLRKESETLLSAVLALIKKGNFNDASTPEFDNVNEILAGISLSRASQGFSPRETAIFVFSLKEAFIGILQENIPDLQVQKEEILKINKLLDTLALLTMETFIKGREEVILRQTSEISEISTPVIQIWDGILALPIIGTLDSARTQIVMESLLLKIVDTESTIAILDISGVPAVDSLVA